MNKYAIVTCEFTFEASHHLSGNSGRCQRPHGHSYRLQVSLRGPIVQTPGRSDNGTVIPFEELERSVERMILQGMYADIPCSDIEGGLDYNDLNALTGIRTTPENMVHWIWDALVTCGVPDNLLYRIRLWETEKWCAEITHAERGTDKVEDKEFE